MKKIIENALALICMFSLVLGGAETEDGGIDLLWTLGCLAVAFLSGWALNKMLPAEKKKEDTTL